MKACILGLLLIQLLSFNEANESSIYRIQAHHYSLHPHSLTAIKRQNMLKSLLSIRKRNVNPRHNLAVKKGSVWAKASEEVQSEAQ